MRVLLLALPGTDHTALRTSLATALGATAVDVCQGVEAGVTWLENRPCDLVAVAGAAATVRDSLERLRRASRAIPLLALLPETGSPEAGAAWLAGADDVLTIGSLSAGVPSEELDDVRHADRDVARRIQKLWYAGGRDALRQQFQSRLSTRFRDVGLTGEGLSGLTTQDFEGLHSAALVVNALAGAEVMVLGVRRVKRTHPSLAITVVADSAHHDALRRAGADECVGGAPTIESVLQAVGRAQARCRTTVELDALRARETRLRALVEQLPEAVLLVSPEHAVLAVNLAGLRLIGAHDARQVLGAPLAPWVQADGDDGLTTLVDTVVAGASRDIVATTRQLPEQRRLMVRAVPFQRESGGRPAALMVIRDMAGDSAAPTHAEDVLPAPLEDLSGAWEGERRVLSTRVAALERELAEAASAAQPVPALEDTTAVAQARDQECESALQVVARLDVLGVSVDHIPALLDAAERLRTLETHEWPSLQARLQALEVLEADVVPTLRQELDAARTAAVSADELTSLRQRAERLDEVERIEIPSLQAAAAAQVARHQADAAALAEMRDRVIALEAALAAASETADADLASERARHAALVEVLERQLAERATSSEAVSDASSRIAELEEQIAEAAVQRLALQADAARAQALERQLDALVVENLALEANVASLSQAAAASRPGPAAQKMSAEQEWMLEEVAALGVVHADERGHIIMANDRAARACGFGSGEELVRAGVLPEPIRALAGDDLDAAARFEVCLQADADVTARWVTGVRLPRHDGAQVTWWLADVTVQQPHAAREQARVQAMSSVLEVATAECASLVAPPAALVLGPRPADARQHRHDDAAVARAKVMLGQLTALGRRRSTARAEDLRDRLSALAPLLERLCGEEIACSLTVPDQPVYACVAAADFERCLTALVTSGRDALPLGGKVAVVLDDCVPLDAAVIRKPEAMVSLEIQGYGVTAVRVAETVADLVHGMGARLDVSDVGPLAARISLRVPRAFLLTHAA